MVEVKEINGGGLEIQGASCLSLSVTFDPRLTNPTTQKSPARPSGRSLDRNVRTELGG